MALTFNSKSIKKVVDIDNIQKLSSPEIRLLKEELEKPKGKPTPRKKRYRKQPVRKK